MAADHDHVVSTVWDEWETFRNLGHFVNHWERPGWTEHTETYHWFLTFETADELHQLAEQCQSELDDISTLDPVPPALLHLTIERLGFADSTASKEVDDIIEAARQRCSKLSPVSIRIGPLTGSAGAVRFSVTPHEPTKSLRNLLMDARSEVLGEDDDQSPSEESKYVPHVTIAYSNAEVSSSTVVQRVERLRDLGSVDVLVERVDLVRLRRNGRVYVWDPVMALEFGG